MKNLQGTDSTELSIGSF